MKTGLPSKWAMVMLSMALAACGEAPPPNTPTEPAPTVQVLKDTPVMPMALQEVVDTYVLGGTRTDLQRETMTAKLVGATVSWRFKVYDIAKEDGRYRVMSELMDGTEPGAFGKFTVVAFVTPRDEQDVQALLKLQTGSEVEVRGRVDGVTVRTALVLSPAELVR
jgi:predicted small lipoprotein YifL